MIDEIYFEKELSNFIKENTQILDLSQNTISSDSVFDIVIIKNSLFEISEVSRHLKKSGHLFTLQKNIDNIPNFNLENICEDLRNNNFKIIKCDQEYVFKNSKRENYFFILAKKSF